MASFTCKSQLLVNTDIPHFGGVQQTNSPKIGQLSLTFTDKEGDIYKTVTVKAVDASADQSGIRALASAFGLEYPGFVGGPKHGIEVSFDHVGTKSLAVGKFTVKDTNQTDVLERLVTGGVITAAQRGQCVEVLSKRASRSTPERLGVDAILSGERTKTPIERS